MKAFNSYLLTLAAALSLGTVVLAAYHVQTLDAYLAAYVVTYFTVTVMFGHIGPRAARALSRVGYTVAGAFLLMSLLRALVLFRGTGP